MFGRKATLSRKDAELGLSVDMAVEQISAMIKDVKESDYLASTKLKMIGAIKRAVGDLPDQIKTVVEEQLENQLTELHNLSLHILQGENKGTT